jgi:hypothetical protein
MSHSAKTRALVILLGAALGSCAAAPAGQSERFSIREIMAAEVDPAADGLWDSVSTTINAAGRTDKQPHTAEEWQAVRYNAVTLYEAANLITMPGRQIAPPRRDYPHEARTAILQQRLDSRRQQFLAFADALRSVSLRALDAIDAKDAGRLFDVGSEIDEVCEACHVVFWYPMELEPKEARLRALPRHRALLARAPVAVTDPF